MNFVITKSELQEMLKGLLGGGGRGRGGGEEEGKAEKEEGEGRGEGTEKQLKE